MSTPDLNTEIPAPPMRRPTRAEFSQAIEVINYAIGLRQALGTQHSNHLVIAAESLLDVAMWAAATDEVTSDRH